MGGGGGLGKEDIQSIGLAIIAHFTGDADARFVLQLQLQESGYRQIVCMLHKWMTEHSGGLSSSHKLLASFQPRGGLVLNKLQNGHPVVTTVRQAMF